MRVGAIVGFTVIVTGQRVYDAPKKSRHVALIRYLLSSDGKSTVYFAILLLWSPRPVRVGSQTTVTNRTFKTTPVE